MVRISGVVLLAKKHIVIAIRSIYGIGKVNSFYVCRIANISPYVKVEDLDDEYISAIHKVLSDFDVEGNLRRRVAMNIKRLKDIKSYRGLRHKLNLPVRGQKTKTNAKTRKRYKKR